MTSLSGAVGLLERALCYTIGGLGAVTPEALSRPTPCPEWDLRALSRHVADSLAALYEATDDGRVMLGTSDADSGPFDERADPVVLIRDRARRVLGSWAGADEGAAGESHGDRLITVGDRPMRSDMVASVGAIEIAVHGWDIRRACGSPLPIPPALAADLLDLAPAFVTGAERPSLFAAPVPVSPAASAGDRLIAFLGRDPN
jgi:uncharacterized protein (TIGR03086 family)